MSQTKPRKQYTEEFKSEAVRLRNDSGKPVAQARARARHRGAPAVSLAGRGAQGAKPWDQPGGAQGRARGARAAAPRARDREEGARFFKVRGGVLRARERQ
jgi:transposase-like protein